MRAPQLLVAVALTCSVVPAAPAQSQVAGTPEALLDNMWLDNTAATNFAPEGIGHAKPDGDRIPFIFTDADGSGIHTTFAYDRATDTWSWTIDNVDKSGKPSSFAKLTLTRKK